MRDNHTIVRVGDTDLSHYGRGIGTTVLGTAAVQQ